MDPFTQHFATNLYDTLWPYNTCILCKKMMLIVASCHTYAGLTRNLWKCVCPTVSHFVAKSVHMYKMCIDWCLVGRHSELVSTPGSICSWLCLSELHSLSRKHSSGSGVSWHRCPAHTISHSSLVPAVHMWLITRSLTVTIFSINEILWTAWWYFQQEQIKCVWPVLQQRGWVYCANASQKCGWQGGNAAAPKQEPPKTLGEGILSVSSEAIL